MRATGHMQISAKCLVAGSLLQVVAAGILVFGPGPLPKLGIAGAAAGIVIGISFSAILLLHYLMTQCVELRLRFSGMKVQLAPMVAILKVPAAPTFKS